MRIVRAVEHVVFAADLHAQVEHALLEDDAVDVDAAHVLAGRLLRLGRGGGNVVPADVEPADEVGQGAAAVRSDELELRVAIEEPVVDAARYGERRVEGEAD